MSNKVEVKKIVLQIGKKEIPLSLDEAKELKNILADIFEKPDVYIPYPTYPYPVYPYRYHYWTCDDTIPTRYTITCNSANSAV